MPAGLERALAAPRGPGAELAPALRGGFERRLQADFTHVRVHADDRAHALNEALGSHAFTLGPDVFFRRGEYQPHTPAGQGLLAHELTHVVQQAATPGPALVQRKIYIGKEPDVPGNFRNTTTVEGFREGVTAGGDPFGDPAAVVADNIANAGGGGVAVPAPVVGPGPFPRSDHSNFSLLTRAEATQFSPEVDHIVPKAEGGSNTDSNARVLSKGENTNPATPRPAAANIDLVAYADYSVTWKKPVKKGKKMVKQAVELDVEAGEVMDLDQAKAFARYAGFLNLPSLAAFSGKRVKAVVAEDPGYTQNDVEIEEA